tara:strand:- start:1154 stop:1345 length:192 start_codon:yes stop_codon:yes gene_type:complete
MKITKRQLKRIIREVYESDLVDLAFEAGYEGVTMPQRVLDIQHDDPEKYAECEEAYEDGEDST